MAICVGCGEEKTIKAKGACNACYYQFKRTGSYDRQRQPRGMCTVEGCDKPAHGRGMCHMHLKRLRVSGSLNDPRADNVNLMTNQALYAQWSNYRRKNAYPIVAAWKEDFFAFMAGVGDRPSKDHRLYRIDKTKPLGPGNFAWRVKLASIRTADETVVEYEKRRRAGRKERFGTSIDSSNLMLRYGITLDRYLEMYTAQNGMCAICGKPETELDANGFVKALAVDHDKITKVVRQLLCAACNTGIGKFRHDVSRMTLAIAYLKKHNASVTG